MNFLICCWKGFFKPEEIGESATIVQVMAFFSGVILFGPPALAILIQILAEGTVDLSVPRCYMLILGGILLGVPIPRVARVATTILRFRKMFGFLPPTDWARNLRIPGIAVNAELVARAQRLASIYNTEEALLRQVRQPLLAPHQYSEMERELRRIQRQKRRARRAFYGARDTANSPYLPDWFAVKRSFRDYIFP